MATLYTDVSQVVEFINANLNDIINDALKTDLSIYEFIGYDPEKFLAALKSKEPVLEKLKEDLLQLSIISQMRGVNLSKIKERIGQVGKMRIEQMIAKYDIKVHAKGLNSSVITVPRMLTMCPEMIYNLRKNLGARFRILGTVPSGLPQELCFPGGAAMIKDSNTALLASWKAWYSSFAAIVKITVTPEQMELPQKYSLIPQDRRV